MALCSCSPQSQRRLDKISPVKQLLCTRVSTGSFGSQLPFTNAKCSAPDNFSLKATRVKWPKAVGISTRTNSSINESVRRRKSIKSLIDTTLIPNRDPISSSCGNLAILPSSFITSTRAPAGCNPASRARSMVASV